MTVSALIPAFNEEDRIGATVRAVRALGTVDEVIVVDDGSTDRTALVAEQAGADVVLRQPNGGKGAALAAAYAVSQGEIVVLLDGDLGESAREAEALIAPVVEDGADMTIATFPIRKHRGGVGLVVRLARWGIRQLTGEVMLAPLSGQRAIRREVIDAVGGFASGWGVEIALTVNAYRGGWRVTEVPTTMTHRVTGRRLTDVLHRGQQFLAACRVLWYLARVASPDPKHRPGPGRS